ncbi:hypothetical protein RUM43_000125 [Polyplax serrata]|uniref:Ligatin n=1 Tax=Polyplax serrata TaxID=468196 RepID=A0AAN8SCC4_POLSC
MFKKQFKLRCQNQLKNTEKKKFGSDLISLFPALKDEDIASLISSKESVVRIKVTTFKDEEVDIYCVNKIPMYIEVVDSNVRLPTVFMLWKFPDMVPVYTISEPVLDKLKNGADLFFPGIYKEGLLHCDVNFKKKDPIGVNLISNKAAVAVGVSLCDKSDVVDPNLNKDVGKLLKIYHTAGDYLFKMQNNSSLMQLGPPSWTVINNQATTLDSDAVEELSTEKLVAKEVDQEEENLSQTVLNESKLAELQEPEPEKDVNSELLEYCFMKSVKTIPKTLYPILPATFYGKYILANLPEGKSLNLKKTRWKKFSIFLQEKSLEGIIKLQQLPKNEFTIASGNSDHPLVKSFVDPYNVVSVVIDSKGDNKPVIQQVYFVSAASLPFFAKFGLKKHDELTKNDVRNHLNDYIKSENLADPTRPEFIVLDPILNQVLKGENVISRGNLLAGLLDKMSVQHKVSNCGNGETILHKGKMPLIEFETCLRTGNKKVTLISNLECYGVNVTAFSKELQHKAAASTTLIPSVPGKKGPQIQVQGNQVAVAFSILKEKYNMTDKCMKGLEKAVKSKSKK